MTFSLVEFFGGLVLMLLGSRFLPRGIGPLGARLRLGSGHLGLLTALTANSPEITAGITGLISGAHDAGYGVVLGSNIFNLAGLLALGALVAGRVELRREALILHGVVGIAITVVAVALLQRWLAPWEAALSITAVYAPYVVLLGLDHSTVLGLPGGHALAAGVLEQERAEDEQAVQADDGRERSRPSWRDVAGVFLPAFTCVVVGGAVMTRGALAAGAHFGVAPFLVGGVLLAALTGIPNVVTALDLARRGKGRAVVSETLNSNTLNLIFGVALPALVFGTGTVGSHVGLAGWWLLAGTLLALGSTAGGGLGRRSSCALVLVYLAFVATVVATS